MCPATFRTRRSNAHFRKATCRNPSAMTMAGVSVIWIMRGMLGMCGPRATESANLSTLLVYSTTLQKIKFATRCSKFSSRSFCATGMFITFTATYQILRMELRMGT
jgi:hypothetical protein